MDEEEVEKLAQRIFRVYICYTKNKKDKGLARFLLGVIKEVGMRNPYSVDSEKSRIWNSAIRSVIDELVGDEI